MRKAMTLVCTGCIAMGAAYGQDAFFEAIEEARRLHEAGQYDKATEAYHQAMLERPEAEVVPYGLGAVLYEKAMTLAQEGRGEEAVAALERAREHFNKVKTEAEDSEVRREAAYAAASAAAHLADLRDPQQEYDQKIGDLESAIEELGDFVARNPEHENAQHNLDAARLRRKQLLMQPPPPQQEQQQGEDDEEEEDEDEEEEGEEQEQQGQQQQDEDEQDQEQQDEGSEETGEDEEQPRQQDQPENGDDQQEQPQNESEQGENEEQEQTDGQPGDEQGEEEETPAGSQTDQEQLDEEDMQNIQAILESLEEMDEREQRSQKQRGGAQEMRGDWW